MIGRRNGMQVSRLEWSCVLLTFFVSYTSACPLGTHVGHEGSNKKCGGAMNQLYGNLASIKGAKYYFNDLKCTWKITAPNGRALALEFLRFDLENDRDGKCLDYIEVQVIAEGKWSPKYCGEDDVPVFHSPGGHIGLHFQTSSENVCLGFAAKWYTVHPEKTVLTGPTTVKANVEYTWTCVSVGATVKAPRIDFRDGKGNAFTQTVTHATTTRSDQYNNTFYTVISSLKKAFPSNKALVTLQCHALRNVHGVTSEQGDSLDITVVFHPESTHLTGPREVNSGVDYTWTCVSNGTTVKAPIVEFRHGNGTRMDGIVTKTIANDTDPYNNAIYTVTVTLTKAMPANKALVTLTKAMPANKALVTLTCHAVYSVNDYTSHLVASLEITVICHEVPLVTKDGNDTIVTPENAQITIPCQILTCPGKNTFMQWTHTYGGNNRPIDVGLASYENGTISSPSLVIKSVEPSDSGKYVCRATNMIGEGTFATATTLVVQYKPVFDYPWGITFEGNAGDYLTIPCIADAVPNITMVIWKRNSTESTSIINIGATAGYSGGKLVSYISGFRRHFRYDLTIDSLNSSDFDAEFFCVAINDMGNSTSASVTIAKKYAWRDMSPAMIISGLTLIIVNVVILLIFVINNLRRLHEKEKQRRQEVEDRRIRHPRRGAMRDSMGGRTGQGKADVTVPASTLSSHPSDEVYTDPLSLSNVGSVTNDTLRDHWVVSLWRTGNQGASLLLKMWQKTNTETHNNDEYVATREPESHTGDGIVENTESEEIVEPEET